MIRFLVDSASDISNTNSENILVVPLSINMCGKDYLDGINLTHEQFYEMLISTNEFPKTSQPSPKAFVDAFESIDPEDELICILLSSGVSGTYQSACLAKNIVGNDNIYIVDSLTGSYGAKLLILAAQRMIKEGKKAAEIVDELNELKKRITVMLSVDTLEYLYKGGRLDRTAALIGSIAKIKPVIIVTREGKIGVASKAIGMNKAMTSIADTVCDVEVDENYPLYTINTLGTKNIEKFEAKLSDRNIKIEERVNLGPVVGTHTGPETFGVIFVAKNEDKIPL